MPEAAWKPKVEKRRHPFGEQGVNHSLEQVAKKAAEGSSDWRVRRYVGEVLKNAGIRKATNDRQIAVALLKAVQQKTWMPDPVGTEWMPGAHLMTCVDKDTPCFHGGDCDDLSILLGACFLCAGLYTIIVGHAYNSKKQIQHVLCAVRVEGQWLYADPSTDLPLGKSTKFTRERWLSVPNVKVICDNSVCSTDLKGFDPMKNNFVTEGQFIAVDGVPISNIVWEEPPPIQWLGGAEDDAYASAAKAAEEEWDETEWPPSEDDAERIGGAAGSAAAVAVCTAYGAAAAASICAYVGNAVGRYVAGLIVNGVNAVLSAGRGTAHDSLQLYFVRILLQETVPGLKTMESGQAEQLARDFTYGTSLRGRAISYIAAGHNEGTSRPAGYGEVQIEACRLLNPGWLGANRNQNPCDEVVLWSQEKVLEEKRRVYRELAMPLITKAKSRAVAAAAAAKAVEEYNSRRLLVTPTLTKTSATKSSALPTIIGVAAVGGVGWLLWSAFA